MLLLLHTALAQDIPSPEFRRARAVAITGSAIGGGGALLFGVALLSTFDPPDSDGCVDWCGNIALTLATGGVGLLLFVPGTAMAVGGAARMGDLQERGLAVRVGPGSVELVGTF